MLFENYPKTILMCAVSIILNVVPGKCADGYQDEQVTWNTNTKSLFQSEYSKECEKHDTWDEDIELLTQGLPISSRRRNAFPRVTDPFYNLNLLASVAALQDPIPIIASSHIFYSS